MSQEKTYFQPQKTIFSLKKLLMFLGKLSAHVSYKDVLIKKKSVFGRAAVGFGSKDQTKLLAGVRCVLYLYMCTLPEAMSCRPNLARHFVNFRREHLLDVQGNRCPT